MTIQDSTLFDSLGFDPELLDIFDDSSEFAPSGNSFRLRQGVKTPFRGTMNGKDYEAIAFLHSASLSRLSIIDHEVRSSSDKRMTKIVSGVYKPVHMDLYITRDNEEIHIAEFLLEFWNERRILRGQEPWNIETFARKLNDMNLPLWAVEEYGINPSMPMIWQHFGANEETLDQSFRLLRKYGAVDAMPPPERANNIVAAIAMPASVPGIPIVEMEIGRNDRSRAATFGKTYKDDRTGENVMYQGSGFVDFVDAIWGSFQRGVLERNVSAALKAKIAQEKAARKPDIEKIKTLTEQSEINRRKMSSWMNNWGGSQRRPAIQPDGTLKFTDIYDAGTVPSGRVIVLDGEDEVMLDFWKSRDDVSSGSTSTNSGPIDTTGDASTDAEKVTEPF